MKIKEIQVGKCYTDKNNNSVRKVIYIKDDKLTYKILKGRYKLRIGKDYGWEIKRFASWANSVCDDIKIDIEEFFKNPKEGTMLRLKDEFTLEDFFKLDGLDLEDMGMFNIEDFKMAVVGSYSSSEEDEYDIVVKRNSFPCSREEFEKFFDIL